MAVGIYARVSAKDYSSLMGNGGFQAAANIMIAAGALVMIIGFIGCCGAMKENKWLLLMVRRLGRVHAHNTRACARTHAVRHHRAE